MEDGIVGYSSLSPDLTPKDFFVGQLKTGIYVKKRENFQNCMENCNKAEFFERAVVELLDS